MVKQKKILEDLPALVAPIRPDLIEMEPKTGYLGRHLPFEVLCYGGIATIIFGKLNGERCIVKMFDFRPSEKEAKKQIKTYQNGMRNMLDVKSCRLVKPIFDYYKEYARKDETEPRLAYFQVMPYIKSKNLYDYIKINQNRMSREICDKIGLQIVQGLYDLHEQGIILCDFRMNNILIEDGTLAVYLCDFDFALYEDKQPHSFASTETLWDWISPPEHKQDYELKKAHQFTTATDIYRLGHVLYSLYAKDTGTIIKKDKLSSAERSMIEKCINPDPNKRPSIAKVLRDFKEMCKPVKKMSFVTACFPIINCCTLFFSRPLVRSVEDIHLEPKI